MPAVRPVALLACAIYLALVAGHGWTTGFFTVLNDFWGNAFAATHWSWNARQQWNGFFPPGYPTVLAVLPGRRLVESAYYLNVVAGLALLVAVWHFVRRHASPTVAFAAGLAVALHPLVVTQILTTGPDAWFVTLTVAGALATFTVAQMAAPGWGGPLIAGLLLGLAPWIRFHGLTWAPAVVVAALACSGRGARRPLWRTAAVVAVFAAGLAVIGVLAGDLGALTRDQAFNTYKGLVRPVNWFHLDREPLPTSLADAVARDPAAFWRNYRAFGAPHLWLGAAAAAAAAIARGRARRFAIFVLVAGLVFVPLVNLGASPRGVVSYVPLVLVALVWAAADARARIPTGRLRTAVTAAALVAAVAYGWLVWRPEITQYVQDARARAAASARIAAALRRDRVKLATQVFAVADFYFVDAPGWHVGNYFPRIKGGWPTIDLPLFLETYPPPSTASLDAFLDDCQRFGISHLVLSEAAGGMLRELGQLYDGRLTSPRTVEVDAWPGVRLLRIVR